VVAGGEGIKTTETLARWSSLIVQLIVQSIQLSAKSLLHSLDAIKPCRKLVLITMPSSILTLQYPREGGATVHKAGSKMPT
jgi:hypothetical protein